MPRVLITSTLLILSLFSLSSSAHQNGDQNDGVDSELRSSRSLVLAKAWCLLAVFAGTFLGGVSPYFLRWDERCLASGTHFAGGVFLATALIHFLADAHRTFAALTPKEYPFAFTLACAGYLLTLLADCVVSHVLHNKTRRQYSRRGVDFEAQGNAEEGKVGENGGTPLSQIQSGDTHHPANPAASVATLGSFGDSVLLIVALCFHSVFEGIAIGVAETEADAWKALWTISLHKIFAAIAMGIALLRMIPNRPLLSCAAYAFAFAISSPVGVGIGILIDATTQGRVADWIFAISMGLACGVFIYVSINHLLAKGYVPQKPIHVDTPFVKFFAVLLGVGVIAIVMIWDT